MNIDTVGELIEALEAYEPDTPVRIAQQPSWPFEYTVGTVTRTPDIFDFDPDDVDDDTPPPDPVVWLAEGHQVGYLPGIASRALGWR
ncbi:hypothetical protein [Haloechinothrix halophila]|uniref:hypothetical protein n=1 Tax=Haloechinothrix halophila TaxID=1069073 RepID=UPI0004047CB1|nr:hypothetical protein [Haloechinothrix halophila]